MAETNAHLVTKLAVNLEALSATVNALRHDAKTNNQQFIDMLLHLKTLENQLKTCGQNIDQLITYVRDGNGKPALIARTSKLEDQMESLFVEMEQLKQKYDTVVTAKMLTRGQIVAGSIGMITTALLSLGAILAQLMR